MGEDSHRVALRGGGWPGDIAHCHHFTIDHPGDIEGAGIRYTRIAIPEFFFEHAATILVVQGMIIQEFFPPDVYFEVDHGGKKVVLARGPFIYLAGELSMPWDPPLRLKDVLLAADCVAPEGFTREAVLAALLRDIRK